MALRRHQVAQELKEFGRAARRGDDGGEEADEQIEEADGAAVMEKPEIVIRADLSAGTGECTVWTCDFSYDYVKINAEYRT